MSKNDLQKRIESTRRELRRAERLGKTTAVKTLRELLAKFERQLERK